MKPNKHEDSNKKLLSAVEESYNLSKISRETPWVKLDKPIQTGWLKYHKLRDDCASRYDAQIFNTILSEIDVPVFCRKTDFKDRHGVAMNAGLKVIRQNVWDNLNWPESYKKYFLFGTYLVDWDCDDGRVPCYIQNKKQVTGYKIKQAFYFEEVVKPYFVTHRKPILPEIESRQAELSAFIEKNGGWSKYEYIKKGASYRHRYWADHNSEWLNREDPVYLVECD